MKIILILTILFNITFNCLSQENYGDAPTSKILEELNKTQTIHIINSWQLESNKSDNKMDCTLEAIKYKALNKHIELKGIKVTFNTNAGIAEESAAKSSKQFIGYIDQDEYSETMVVLNQMLQEFQKRTASEKRGEMSYITKGGIKFGFIYTEENEIGYLSILYSNAEFCCEFSDIDKFLLNFRKQIDIAQKDLYLPQNAEKLKKAKKSNIKAKDVLIDDI